MTKALIINSQTKVITNIISDYDESYEPPHGREVVRGTGKLGEVFKAPKAKPAKKSTT